jgi:hypothetical protein
MLSPEDALDGGLEEKAVILFVAHLANRSVEGPALQLVWHTVAPPA